MKEGRNLPNGNLLLSAAVSAFYAGLLIKLEIETGKHAAESSLSFGACIKYNKLLVSPSH